jgi:hypothetical protein
MTKEQAPMTNSSLLAPPTGQICGCMHAPIGYNAFAQCSLTTLFDNPNRLHTANSRDGRGLAQFAEYSEQIVPVPLSADSSGISSKVPHPEAHLRLAKGP